MNSEAPEARYAIYFVPRAESALYLFGAAVLGYDTYTGRNVPCLATAHADWPDMVRAPRVYGFHATLKPPFRLVAAADESDLKAACDAFVTSQRRVDVGPLEVRALDLFIALVPATPCSALDHLAAACVRHFDRFRAPLTAQERAGRLAATLTERQTIQLDRWGYPYVFDDFRFHLTLTGPLTEIKRPQAKQWLAAEFTRRPAAQRLMIDQIVITRQAGSAFCVIHSAPLGD